MFSFEHATLSSNSVKEEGVLIVPKGNKDLHPLFVPKDRSVPFYLDFDGESANDYFDNEDLNSVFESSTNLINLWSELAKADIYDCEYWSWTLLDINSNIILEVTQAEGYYDNMLEVSIADAAVFSLVIQTAYEQNFVLSKTLYQKYMEVKGISKQDLFDELKSLGDDGSYAAKIVLD